MTQDQLPGVFQVVLEGVLATVNHVRYGNDSVNYWAGNLGGLRTRDTYDGRQDVENALLATIRALRAGIGVQIVSSPINHTYLEGHIGEMTTPAYQDRGNIVRDYETAVRYVNPDQRPPRLQIPVEITWRGWWKIKGPVPSQSKRER